MKPLNDKDRFDVLCMVVYQEHGSFIIIQVVKNRKHHANDRLKNTKSGIFVQNKKNKQPENHFQDENEYRGLSGYGAEYSRFLSET